MTDEQPNNIEFTIDRSNLYLEESFTDLKAGTIKRFTPVRPDGSQDNTRKTVFVGHASILTPDRTPSDSKRHCRQGTTAGYKKIPRGDARGYGTFDGRSQKIPGTGTIPDPEARLTYHRPLNERYESWLSAG